MKEKFKKIKCREYITEYVYQPNGLQVLYAHIPGSPTVTTNIVYRVGSKNERTEETGLSHMLEHMLFKQTSGTGIKWKDLENKGAVLNATTWLDRTLYYFTLPKAYLGDMLAVEADRMRNLIISDTEFMPERANVLSEYELYNSNPQMALEWQITATAFQFHGYHHDTIGFRSDIEAYTTDFLRAYYDRYYWPDNATVIIAGDITTTQVLELVHEHFRYIHRGPTIVHNQKVEPVQEGERRVALIRKTPLRVLNIAFKAPAFTNRSWMALLIACQELTNGETSVLHRILVDTQLATSVEANLYPTHDPFLVFFNVQATEHTPYATLETAVFDAIQTLAKKPMLRGRHELIKAELRSSDIFSRDGSHAVAIQLGEYVATGKWERYFDQLDELKSITPKETMEAVRTYLSRAHATIGTIEK